MLRPTLLIFLLLLSPALARENKPIIREPGAIYLSDFDLKPIRLKVLEPAPASSSLQGNQYIGTLRAGQSVELIAVSDTAYRVRGQAQQGQILGWVLPKYLQPLEPDFLANLKESEKRRVLVEELIANNEAAIGMTTEEVERSLGRPNKKTRKADKDGVRQVWEYVKYQLIPQNTYVRSPFGVVTTSTTYVKTPIGKLSVHFKDEIVESIEQSEGTVLTGNEVTIVPAPIFVY